MLKPFDDEVWKAIPVAELISILAQLPPNCWLSPNSVNNLVVFDNSGCELGYVDIASEEYKSF